VHPRIQQQKDVYVQSAASIFVHKDDSIHELNQTKFSDYSRSSILKVHLQDQESSSHALEHKNLFILKKLRFIVIFTCLGKSKNHKDARAPNDAPTVGHLGTILCFYFFHKVDSSIHEPNKFHMLDNSRLSIVKVHLRDQPESCSHAPSIDLEFGSTNCEFIQDGETMDTIRKLTLKSLHNKIE